MKQTQWQGTRAAVVRAPYRPPASFTVEGDAPEGYRGPRPGRSDSESVRAQLIRDGVLTPSAQLREHGSPTLQGWLDAPTLRLLGTEKSGGAWPARDPTLLEAHSPLPRARTEAQALAAREARRR